MVKGTAKGVGPVQGTSAAPHFSGQEESGYAEGMGQDGTRLDGEEEIVPQEAMQVLHPAALLDDRSNIMGPVFVCAQACVCACQR